MVFDIIFSYHKRWRICLAQALWATPFRSQHNPRDYIHEDTAADSRRIPAGQQLY